MLGHWQSHEAYQKSMINSVNRIFKQNPKSIEFYSQAILKMYFLNLDTVYEDFATMFSSTGRPSNLQPQLFRSLLLMSHFKLASIDEWVSYASGNEMLRALVCVDSQFPGASTHRDFYQRLWLAPRSNKLKPVSSNPSGRHGKSKLPPKHSGSVKRLVDKALSGKVFKHIPERLYQALFMKTAVIPSANLGLLGVIDKLITSADGSCVKSNASARGRKTCNCSGKCDCPRSFSDPDAKWGWDSYHEQWFYGYTAYLLSVNNIDLKLDLPIYIKFVDASRSDSVSLITALSHARYLCSDILSFDTLIADAAHDNYPTYELCMLWGIKPVIPLNNRSDNRLQPNGLVLSSNGIPVCPDGHEMLDWGFDKTKYRHKYRCPMVTGKVKHCPYASNCFKTRYGKTLYVRLASNLRLLTPIPRNSVAWKNIYKRRTASERVNNRILTDYQLEHQKRYGKAKLAFFAFINAINVHLDAQVKFSEVSGVDLVA